MNEVHMRRDAFCATADDPAPAEVRGSATGGPAAAEAPGLGADELAAVVASRICHDVVSPLGAIANGVELMLLSGAERTPELDLIADSVEGATARIRYFRLAFGASKGRLVGAKEINAILRGIERTSRLSYDWAPAGDHPREEIRAVLLLMQCMESALPMGGRIQVSHGGSAWSLEAEGPRLRIDQAAWDAVGPARAAPPDSAALVQFAILPSVLDGLGRRLDLLLGPDRILARI